LAVGLEGMQSSAGAAVIDPGLFFRASTVITIVGGTVFLMWLGEQITQRGIGNGISLIIFAGIVAELPRAIGSTLELGRQGEFNAIELLGLFAMIVGVIVMIVYFERAQRRRLCLTLKKMQRCYKKMVALSLGCALVKARPIIWILS